MSDGIFDAVLLHSVTVLRATKSQDSVGGPVNTWGTQVGTLICRISPIPLEQSALASLRLSCHTGSDIRDEDQIIGIRDRYSGTAHPQYGNKKYNVKSAVDAAGQAHHLVASLTELSGRAA